MPCISLTHKHTRTHAHTYTFLSRVYAMVPALRGAKIEATWAGLRPVRNPLRCEVESVGGTQVVHNYGHGGAGVTASWGCAEYVVSLVEGLR